MAKKRQTSLHSFYGFRQNSTYPPLVDVFTWGQEFIFKQVLRLSAEKTRYAVGDSVIFGRLRAFSQIMRINHFNLWFG